MGEKVFFKSKTSGVLGMVFNIEPNVTSIVILGKETAVAEGDIIIRSGETIQVKVGYGLLGSIVDPFGQIVWSNKETSLPQAKAYRPIEIKAPVF